jgi:ubiquinone/menaquinone biosynthesis C-methylase UbiE
MEGAMSVGGWLFASVYDRMTAATEATGLASHRQRLLRDAGGRVLEIGAGTGANLAFYTDRAEMLTLAEPEAPMVRRLERRAREQPRPVAIVHAPAEELPFPDARFDAVVSTLVLCTVADQPRALAEIRRVLMAGGRLLFLEHVRSDDPRIARWQDRLNGLNQIVAHGCHCNRATVEAIRAAGFAIVELTQGELAKAPPFVRPLVVGVASPTPVGAAVASGA